jgi:putative DNA primase/helicase
MDDQQASAVPNTIAELVDSAMAKKPRRRETRDLSNELVTEDQAALEFTRLYSDRLRFDHDAGKWHEWNGSIWQENRTGIAFHWARELARDLAKTEDDRVRYVASKTSFASGVERFARSDPAFAMTAKDWDTDPMLLGTPDGTVDLRTGVLRPSDPADWITKSSAIPPAETADCPLWLRLLGEATNGDSEMARFLQQWCGYCLTGDTREQSFIFVHGDGENGKGVFLNTVSKILGEYHKTTAIETFTASNTDRHPTELAELRGTRMVSSSETEEGRRWAEVRIKQLTGGDTVSARFMRRDFFQYRPNFKITIIGNHTPHLINVGHAMRRRINIVPFVHKPAVKDLQLETKLEAEWPAILRWMIDGCLDWQAKGLTRPGSVQEATGKYFSDQDLWAQWIEEECDTESGNRWKTALSGDLFQSWTTYAKAAGAIPGNKINFAEKLENAGFEPHKGSKGKRGWRGICLHNQESDAWNENN